MAGYVFSIGGDNDPVAEIREAAQKGVFSVYMRTIAPGPFEGTLADFASMKPGDNVYFFCKRRYYGVGQLINVGPDCKYCNYPTASYPRTTSYEAIKGDLLVDYGEGSPSLRWICTFKGDPYFFETGLDTDEILNYKPTTFKMLRAFWKVSFIKLGDEENNSLKEVFLLRHQDELETKTGLFPEDRTTHENISAKVDEKYSIAIDPILNSCGRRDGRLGHEMALEAATVKALAQDQIPALGHWDYISHQVIASPFKPIDYMDKIDIFASRYLDGTTVPCKYLVAELKKDEADYSTIDQVMKYVDWVRSEYAYGDYGAIEACVIAYGYPEDIFDYIERNGKRNYIIGSHPVSNKQWSAIKLISYRYIDGELTFTHETP